MKHIHSLVRFLCIVVTTVAWTSHLMELKRSKTQLVKSCNKRNLKGMFSSAVYSLSLFLSVMQKHCASITLVIFLEWVWGCQPVYTYMWLYVKIRDKCANSIGEVTKFTLFYFRDKSQLEKQVPGNHNSLLCSIDLNVSCTSFCFNSLVLYHC